MCCIYTTSAAQMRMILIRIKRKQDPCQYANAPMWCTGLQPIRVNTY